VSRLLNVICGDCERHFVMSERAWFWHAYRHRAAKQFRRDRAGLRRRILRPALREAKNAAFWIGAALLLFIVELVLVAIVGVVLYALARALLV